MPAQGANSLDKITSAWASRVLCRPSNIETALVDYCPRKDSLSVTGPATILIFDRFQSIPRHIVHVFGAGFIKRIVSRPSAHRLGIGQKPGFHGFFCDDDQIDARRSDKLFTLSDARGALVRVQIGQYNNPIWLGLLFKPIHEIWNLSAAHIAVAAGVKAS